MTAISGIGAVCSLGTGVGALRAGLAEGRDGLAPITRFAVDAFKAKVGGIVPGSEAPLPEGLAPIEALFVAFACTAAREAIADAAIGEILHDRPERVALTLGTCVGVGFRAFDVLAAKIGDALGIAGPRLVATTACAASTSAIGLGRDLLAGGHADVVVALGADVLLPEIFAGFNAVGALAAGKCAPFSSPSGTTLGEGAGALVLEREADARARGATVHGVVLGYGLSADAWHETSPDPSGAGIARALTAALADAEREPAAVDYVNAHGTGTEANDIAEMRALRSVLGARADAIPVSATKSVIGHAQGAAGVLEAIATLVAMREGAVPPTLGFAGPRPGAPRDPVAAPGLRPHAVRVALSTSAGFGGANAVVALARAGAAHDVAPTKARRAVYVVAAGEAHGAERAQLERELAADPRGVDPCALYLTVATRRALKAAGIDVHGALRDRAGLVTAMTRVSPSALREFEASAEKRGLARVSPQAFARMVLNAPAGTAAKLVALRGALATLTTGAGSGLVALAYAAELLATRRELDLVVATGVDERLASDPIDQGDGASALVLCAAPPDHGAFAARVGGIGLAGPGRLEAAAARAIGAHRGVERFSLGPDAASAGVVVARALAALRANELSVGLITAESACAAIAVLLTHDHSA